MKRCARPWLTRIFNRRVAMALLYLAMVAGVALALGLAGTDTLGRLAGTDGWMQARATYFFLWRMFLYAVAARAWWGVRRRLRQRNTPPELLQHLVRTEIAIVSAIVLIESALFVQNL